MLHLMSSEQHTLHCMIMELEINDVKTIIWCHNFVGEAPLSMSYMSPNLWLYGLGSEPHG